MAETSGDDGARGEVTILLGAVRAGDHGAGHRLFDLVYAELRRRAGALMSGRRPGHTLQPTALVHEAYVRLLGDGRCPWEDRAHFFGAATRAMRSILVDHARASSAAKRGGGVRPAELRDTAAPPESADEVLAVNEALARLERVDAVKARIVEMRYFGGLEFSEIARALDLSERTVYRQWEGARAWLFRELTA